MLLPLPTVETKHNVQELHYDSVVTSTLNNLQTLMPRLQNTNLPAYTAKKSFLLNL